MLALFKQKFQAVNFSKLSILTVAFAALLLTGCISVQTNLALHGQGEWNGVQAITLSSDFVELMEEGEGGTSEFSTETEELDELLQQAQNAAADETLNVTFDEVQGDDGSLSYVIQANGSRYETLNEVLFQGEADISVAEVDGQRQITIRYDAAEATEGEAAPTEAEEQMSAEMMEAFGFSIVFRISGGEIISHNADRVEGNTAIWETPGIIEITLTESAEFDPATIAPADAPSGAGISLATLLDAAEQASDAEQQSSTATESTTAEDTTAQTEESAETTTESAMAESAEDSAAETPTEESAPAPTDETSAEAPATEEQALPTSGAILPQNGSAAPVVLAGVVLVALVGAGATTTLRRK